MRTYTAIAAALMSVSIGFTALVAADQPAYASPRIIAKAAKVPASALEEAEQRVILAEEQVAEAAYTLARSKATLKAAKATLKALKAGSSSSKAGRMSRAEADKRSAYAACLSEVDADTAAVAAERCAGELE